MKTGAIAASFFGCASIIFLLYIIYIKQPSGVKVKSSLNVIEGIYYFKQQCRISSDHARSGKTIQFLPFGCFELTQPLYNKHQSDMVETVPDLSQLHFLLQNSKNPLKVKMFKVVFDQKNELWYISLGGKIIATYIGKIQIIDNVKQNSPPSSVLSGWNLPILNNKSLSISVFGTPSNKISDKIDFPSSSSSFLYDNLRSNTNLDKSPFMNDLKSKPQTLVIIIFCTLYWAYIRYNQVPVSTVAISYVSIIENKEYYRIFTASFAHVAFFHILMNMASLYSIGNVEAIIGPVLYFNYTFIMLIGSMLISLMIQHYLIHYRNMEQYRTNIAVGFSCVLFAWLVVFANTQTTYCPIPILPQLFGKLCFPTWTIFDVGAVNLKFNLGPFVLLGFIQIFLPRASFIGHLSGIFIGIFISSGIFRCVSITSLMLFLVYLYAWYFGNGNGGNGDRIAESDNNINISRVKIKILSRLLIALMWFWLVSTSLWFEVIINCFLLLMVFVHFVFPINVSGRSNYQYVLHILECILFFDNCYWLCHFILIVRNIEQIPIFYSNFFKLMLYLLCLLGYIVIGYLLVKDLRVT
jgi:membrane associated rhomboid family serine protease